MNSVIVKTFADLIQNFTFKGKAFLLHKLSPKTGIKSSQVFGYNIELDLSDYIQRSMYLSTFEPDESSWIKSYLKPGMTFVDVGANVGYYSLMAASIVSTSGNVLAFEPSPYAYGKLQTTISKNQIENIQAIQSGLSDASGSLQLFIPRKVGNHSPSMVDNEEGDPIDVPVYRLDEYLTMNQIDCVDLIKIDVEGFEPNVIRGTQNYINNKKIAAILVEFNHYWLTENGSNPSGLYAEIIELGFTPQIPLNLNRELQNIFFTIDR